MPCRMLLKSCAMPPVSWPIASIFCAWRSCASSCARSASARAPRGHLLPDLQHVRLAAVQDRHQAHLDHELAPFLAAARDLEAHLLARERAPVQRDALPRSSGSLKVRPSLSDHLVARVAAHGLVGAVHVDDAEIGVAQHQRLVGRVEDRAVLLLARAQALLGRPALGDVAPDVEHVRLVGVGHRHRVHVEVEPRAVLAHGLASRRCAASPASARRCTSSRSRLSSGVAQRQLGAAEHLVARVAAQALVGRVDVDDAEIGVAQHQRVGGGVEDRAVLLLARAQALLLAPCAR